MDFNHNNNPYNQRNNIDPEGQRQFIRNPGQTLATVSLALGIASIFTMLTVYIPLICGSLAIVLALLSKGYGKKMLIAAKIGVGTAIGGMALVITITGSLLVLLLSSDGSTLVEFGKQLDQQFEQQTGQDLESLLGTSYEDIMQEYAESLGK